ncbi:hypothetical protein ABPG75_010205 [Micractinium tetrahymenae]
MQNCRLCSRSAGHLPFEAPRCSCAGRALVIHQDLANKNSARILALVTSKQKKVLLGAISNSTLLEGLITGLPISVSGSWDDSVSSAISGLLGLLSYTVDSLLDTLNFTPRLLVDDLIAQLPPPTVPIVEAVVDQQVPLAARRKLLADPPPDPLLVALPLNAATVNTLVIPIGGVTSTTYGGNLATGATACSGVSMPSLNPYNVRRTVFEEFEPAAPTVGSTFRQCSINRTLLNQDNSYVAQTVYTKCSGSS